MDRRDALKALAVMSSMTCLDEGSAGAVQNRRVKQIATEEHFLLPDYITAANKFVKNHPDAETRAWLGRGIMPLKNYKLMGERIADFDRRLEYMDRDGIDMQVLSLMQPGVQIFGSLRGNRCQRGKSSWVFFRDIGNVIIHFRGDGRPIVPKRLQKNWNDVFNNSG
jgi:hypothetical protein